MYSQKCPFFHSCVDFYWRLPASRGWLLNIIFFYGATTKFCIDDILFAQRNLKSTPIANFGFSSKGGWFFVAILSCCNLCQLFFLELFLSSQKTLKKIFGIFVSRAAANGSKTTALWTKKSLRGQPTNKKNRSVLGPKINGRTFRRLGGTSAPSHRGLANETDLGILVFLFEETWANDAMRKNLQKKSDL